jgi:hypothetical protein
MAISLGNNPPDILVLCHSFFHEAFRPLELTPEVYKFWKSAVFVASIIVERQAELPEGAQFAITSKQVFDSFKVKFLGDKPSPRRIETVEILRNSLDVIDRPSIAKLSVDDSVFVICDTLYNRSSYAPILISNIPKKEGKAESFYRKKDPDAKIPFPIFNTITTESYLRGRFPELSRLVDSRPW